MESARKGKQIDFRAKKVVSVLDKAFTILAFKNYWKRWNNTGTPIMDGLKVG